MAIAAGAVRPLITGSTHMISAGHRLATEAGYRVLEQGGNATDAGVAAGIVLNVVLPQNTSFGGVAPIIIHDADRGETMTVSGLGRWPKAATIGYFNDHAGGDLPEGVLRTVTPAAADAWMTALKLYGTRTLEQVVAPALELAEQGFPVSESLHRSLALAARNRFLADAADRALARGALLGLRVPAWARRPLVGLLARRLPIPGRWRRELIRWSPHRLPLPPRLQRAIALLQEQLGRDELGGTSWYSTRDIFFPRGQPPPPGSLLVQNDLARTFRRLIEVERANAPRGREAAIQAARDFFYRGDIAREMVRSIKGRGGLLSLEDLAGFQVTVEPPVGGTYKGIDIFTCGYWCQGPVLIETLQILDGYDLKGMGPHSSEYWHTLIEALKLAFADREAYFGDPDFVDVPLEGLLSQSYADHRRSFIDPGRAHPEMPPPGDPWQHQGGASAAGRAKAPPVLATERVEGDTSHVCVVDRWGNAFAATPSDGISSAPVTPGLGFVMSPRGSQTWLDPDHPSSLAPGKRPRLTPSPAMAFKDGGVWMAFGTPGGEAQCQAMAQLLLNMVEFGMDAQEAVEAPRVVTWSLPNSFWPHSYHPGLLAAEGRIPPSVVAALRQLGHNVKVGNDWVPSMGSLCVVTVDRKLGVFTAGADPRLDAYARGR